MSLPTQGDSADDSPQDHALQDHPPLDHLPQNHPLQDRASPIPSPPPPFSLRKVLLVEDSLADARFLSEIFESSSMLCRCELIHVQRLREGLVQLQPGHDIEIILLDLTLPDSEGLASLKVTVQQESRLPIIVLTHLNDDEVAVAAVRHGAQDYLVKRSVNQDSLIRSIRYAIERKQSAEALRDANEALEQRVLQRTAQLQTANQRLKLAQQAGKIGTFEWNITDDSMTWTAELEALYGLPNGAFRGDLEDWISRIDPEDQPEVCQTLRQVAEAAPSFDLELNQEFRMVDAAGERHWMLAKGRAFPDPEAKSFKLIGVQIDITDKKALEAQFLHAQRLESLGTLASGIAHDLNNILTPVLSVAQLLPVQNPDLDDISRRLLTLLDRSAHRGIELVQQILAFARGEENNARVSLEPKLLLQEVAQIIQQTLPKSIAIVQQLPSELWSIMADATQLHQVFLNLCVNARDAMPEGGLLTLRGENVELDGAISARHLAAEPGSYVVLTVSDTGTGISPDLIHRIFDPFFTTKAVGEGTGLGLSAVAGIVQRHRGFVDVQSDWGQGTCFRVFLPATPCAIATPSINLKLLAGNQELILVVDDEEAVRETIQASLELYNYRVLTAVNGAEAIALVAQHGAALDGLIMDVMMPVLDGHAAMRRIRQLQPQLYAVAMTGLHTSDAIALALESGFQTLLAKPFTTAALLHMFYGSACGLPEGESCLVGGAGRGMG